MKAGGTSAVVFGAAILSLLATTACTSAPNSNGPRLLTHDQLDEVPTAQITGELTTVGKSPGCFGILSNGAAYLSLFPVGTSNTNTSIRLTPEGEVSLGQNIKLGGGYFPASEVELDSVPPSCLTEEVFIVSR